MKVVNKQKVASIYKVGDVLKFGAMKIRVNQVVLIGKDTHYAISYQPTGKKVRFGWLLASFLEDFAVEVEAESPINHKLRQR